MESLDRVKFYGNDYRDIICLVFAVSNIRDYDQDEYLGEPEIEAIIAARRARERIAIKQDPSAVILAKRRGKRPLKLRETISRMTGHLADGTTTREELASMGEKRMAHVYEVSRDTARRARDAVLGRAVLGEFEKPSVAASGGQSEIVENTVVQLPTKKDQVISKG